MYCNKCGTKINSSDNFCQNCGTKCLNNEKKSINYERIFLIINILLFPILIYCFYNSFGRLICALLGDIFLGAILYPFIGEYTSFFDEALSTFNSYFFPFIVLFIISIAITKWFSCLMRKNDNYEKKFSKINKVHYLAVMGYLGYLGIHRFMVKDKKGGLLRLGCFFSSILVFAFDSKTYLFVLHLILLGCNFALVNTDRVVALSKEADDNKEIFI